MDSGEYPTREAARSSGQGSGAIRSFDQEQIDRAVESVRARFGHTSLANDHRTEQTIERGYVELAEQLCRLVPAGRDRDLAIDALFSSRGFAVAGLVLRGTAGER